MNEQLKEKILEDFDARGWSFIPSYFNPDFCQNLASFCLKNLSVQQASIGKESKKDLNLSIRNSLTCWIDNWSESQELRNYELFLSDLLKWLNQTFFLSIKSMESQFAQYLKGGFYKKHLDQHHNTKSRKISVITYLNTLNQGGELVIYNKDNKNIVDSTILPKIGDVIMFSSAEIYHEVLPVHNERLSITTWLRDDI